MVTKSVYFSYQISLKKIKIKEKPTDSFLTCFFVLFFTSSLVCAVSYILIFMKKLMGLPLFRVDFFTSDHLYSNEFFILFLEVFQCYEKSIKGNSDKLFL